jgi:hypothetical protein
MAGTSRYAVRWIALPLVCAAVAGAAATAATARTGGSSVFVGATGPTAPLATGIGDPVFLGPQAATAYAMARQTGATYARLVVKWSSIAPKTLPAGTFNRSDPTSPYYDWHALDASLSAAQTAGMTPILDIVSAPGWAYSVKPSNGFGGTPKIFELRAFATAIAAHYDGSAPAAHIFSVWNEPNYTKNLYPQNASTYRAMVNAVADAVHGVDPSDLVLAGELAPFKHTLATRDRNHAIPPLTFMRTMLCLSNTTPVHRTCSTPAKFDVWVHHPYSETGPFGKAKTKGGVELGDLPAMNTLLKTAVRLGSIVSANPVQFWVTEVGWSTNPPNLNGVPMLLEARWMSEAMYQMWRSGVTVATWFLLRDEPQNTPFQSGLYFRSPEVANSVSKPLLAPFRFPFVAYLKPFGAVQIWGRDATSDMQEVTIQEQTRPNGLWKTVATIKTNKYGIFQASLPIQAKRAYNLQAVAPGSGSSRAFSLTVPRDENLIVAPFPKN